ncbi:hypothetical protein AR543_04545 [Paenibacillus bovis]|uniref:DUF2029 domain-containing protein n=2 Tax=Paenibacillus bovis TaxID=1616788 RepID=A0A172ZN28_9BACL|nr:hypothetical protein AR543_04545 [Paenibacillus bovis]
MTRQEWWALALLMAAGLGIRVWFGRQYAGFVSDQELFVQWMNQVREYGLGSVYLHNGGINYPPLFLWLLHGYGAVLQLLGITAAPGSLSYKSILILLDMLALLAVTWWSAGRADQRLRWMVLAGFALNPALIVNSAVWGQVDILNGMLMAGSILLLLASPLGAGILFALALLTKLQSIIIAPVLGWYVLRELASKRFRPLLWIVIGICIPFAGISLYFAGYGGLGAMLRAAYLSAVGMYTQVTMNALNIWYYLVGTAPITSDTVRLWGVISLRSIGFLLLFMAVIYAGIYLWKLRTINTAALLKAGVWVSFAFFMLPTEIHERYSIPALVLLLFTVILDRKWIGLATLLSLTITYNLWQVVNSQLQITGGILVTCLHVIALLWMAVLMLLELRNNRTDIPPVSNNRSY